MIKYMHIEAREEAISSFKGYKRGTSKISVCVKNVRLQQIVVQCAGMESQHAT